MKNSTFTLFLFFAVVFYLFCFPLRLKGELTFIPQWNTSLAAVPSMEDRENPIPFFVSDAQGKPLAGYFSEEGRLLYSTPVSYGAAVHPQGFINYTRSGGEFVIQDPLGRMGVSIDSGGYPLFKGGYLFVLSPTRRGLSRWTMEGQLLWSHDFGSPITCMDVQESGVLLGFLNGNVFFLNPQGQRRIFARWKEDVIYGCALSPTQELFAIVSGLNPQVLSAYTFRGGNPQRLWSRELSEALPRFRYLRFSADSRNLYWNTPRGMETVDWMGENSRLLVLNFPFKDGYFGGKNALTVLFGGGPSGGELLLTEIDRATRLRIPIQGETAPIRLNANPLLFAREGQAFSVARETQ